MSPPPFTLYVVYHKVLYKENIEGFSDDLLNHLCWAAVNEKIPKMYPSYTTGRLIKEWDMKEFSPMYQMLHWYQNSFFHHLFVNKDMIKTKYIGFAQYDQLLLADKFKELSETLSNDKADKLIGCFPYPFAACCDIFSKADWNEHFVKPYNAFYKQNHTVDELEQLPMFLLHTFIMPTWFFEYMMPFVEHITPRIVKQLGWDIRHLAGTLERVYAFCLAFGMLEGKFRQVIHFKGIELRNDQRTEDTLRGVEGH
jgi:hypothetical protein